MTGPVVMYAMRCVTKERRTCDVCQRVESEHGNNKNKNIRKWYYHIAGIPHEHMSIRKNGGYQNKLDAQCLK